MFYNKNFKALVICTWMTAMIDAQLSVKEPSISPSPSIEPSPISSDAPSCLFPSNTPSSEIPSQTPSVLLVSSKSSKGSKSSKSLKSKSSKSSKGKGDTARCFEGKGSKSSKALGKGRGEGGNYINSSQPLDKLSKSSRAPGKGKGGKGSKSSKAPGKGRGKGGHNNKSSKSLQKSSRSSRAPGNAETQGPSSMGTDLNATGGDTASPTVSPTIFTTDSNDVGEFEKIIPSANALSGVTYEAIAGNDNDGWEGVSSSAFAKTAAPRSLAILALYFFI
jgi:hypothetical protein